MITPSCGPDWLEESTHRRIAVHTTEDETFDGILRLHNDEGLLLWNASLVEGPDDSIPLDGDVWIYREKVRFIQTLRM